MPHPLRKLAKRTPSRITSLIRDSSFENIYRSIISTPDYWENVTIQTEVGEFEFTLPEDAPKAYTEEDYEPVMVDALAELLNDNSIFYDIGSQYGYFIGVAQTLGLKPECIHGFEQSLDCVKILQTQWSSSNINHTTVGEGSDQLSIDYYANDHKPPDVMKIDVEGAELAVLNSSKQTLRRHAPTLLVEVHPNKLSEFGHNTAELFEFLFQYNYQISLSDHRKEENNWESFNSQSENISNLESLQQRTYLLRGVKL